MSVTKLVIDVDNLPSVLARFTCFQVWRSVDKSGSPTPYSEITAASDSRAQRDGTIEGPWNLNGLSLSIVLDGGDPFVVTFSGTNPIQLQDVLDQINDVKTGLAIETEPDANTISILSPTTGTGSSVQVTGSATSVLGLATTKTNGKKERPIFGTTIEQYTFLDLDGDSSYWYKVRYFSSSTGAVSEFSAPHQGIPETVTPSDTKVLATANLMDGAGRPISKRRFIFVPMGQITATGTGGNPFVSLSSVDRIEAFTDEAGHMEISLLIGQTFRVFVEGSSFHRDFVVPEDDFDLFEVVSSAPDAFSIQQAPPMPIRVS